MNQSSQLPPTLRLMAGASSPPPPVTDSALLIIDAQREYLDGLLPLPSIGPALERIVKLLGSARASGSPIIHVAHTGEPGGAFDPASGGRIIDRVAPTGDEILVTKSLPNAFANTELTGTLADLRYPHLTVCGFMTHMCVSSTVRAALDMGLTATVVTDAAATRDLPSGDGSRVLAHDHVHEASIAALADRFAAAATTHDLIT